MAKIGYFEVNISDIHLDWGVERKGRERELGEGYVKIPIQEAKRLEIYNSKYIGKDEYGVNLFHARFVDGFKENEEVTLKASGNSGVNSKNYYYAKNLHGAGDLTLIKDWFDYREVNTSNKVKVSVISPDTIQLEVI